MHYLKEILYMDKCDFDCSSRTFDRAIDNEFAHLRDAKPFVYKRRMYLTSIIMAGTGVFLFIKSFRTLFKKPNADKESMEIHDLNFRQLTGACSQEDFLRLLDLLKDGDQVIPSLTWEDKIIFSQESINDYMSLVLHSPSSNEQNENAIFDVRVRASMNKYEDIQMIKDVLDVECLAGNDEWKERLESLLIQREQEFENLQETMFSGLSFQNESEIFKDAVKYMTLQAYQTMCTFHRSSYSDLKNAITAKQQGSLIQDLQAIDRLACMIDCPRILKHTTISVKEIVSIKECDVHIRREQEEQVHKELIAHVIDQTGKEMLILQNPHVLEFVMGVKY